MGLGEDFHAERAASAKAPRRARLSVCENKVEMEGAAQEQIMGLIRPRRSLCRGNGLSEPK